MSEWTLVAVEAQTDWKAIVRAMSSALASDESREFARVGEYTAKTTTVTHVAKTLAKFPALATAYAVGRVVADDGARDIALYRVAVEDSSEATDDAEQVEDDA